jgi:hypothetical protein
MKSGIENLHAAERFDGVFLVIGCIPPVCYYNIDSSPKRTTTERDTFTSAAVDRNSRELALECGYTISANSLLLDKWVSSVQRMDLPGWFHGTFCPSCYADCGKRVLTNAEGNCHIKDLSPDLWFELLAVRDGYTAQFAERVAPSVDPKVKITLPLRPQTTDFSGVVRGKVLDPGGSAVGDAVVEPIGAIVEKGATAYRSLSGLEPIAVTNANGEFQVSYAKPTPRMLLRIES